MEIETRSQTVKMDDQMRVLMTLMESMKNSMEEMKAVQTSISSALEVMKTSTSSALEEMKTGMEEKLSSTASALEGKISENTESTASSLKDSIEKISSIRDEVVSAVNERVSAVEEKVATVELNIVTVKDDVQSVKHDVRGDVTAVREDVTAVKEDVTAVATYVDKELSSVKEYLNNEIQRIENQSRFSSTVLPAAQQFGRPISKLPQYDGKTSWNTYKTQFEIIAAANGWNSADKALHLAASLRGEAADILQTLSDKRRMNCDALLNALNLRFGGNLNKDLIMFQLKNRKQKNDETLQELAADIDRLTQLAFPDYPDEMKETFKLDAFVGALNDLEIKQQIRFSGCKDLRSALVKAMKLEIAQEEFRRGTAVVAEYETSCRLDSTAESYENNFEKVCRKVCQKFVKQLEQLRNRTDRIRCWYCGGNGHTQSRCREIHGSKKRMDVPRAKNSFENRFTK